MWWVGGGGMFNFKSSPTIINCTLKENSAESGGGMYNISHRGDSRPTLTDCIFSENSAIYGGGMCNYRSSPIMANCTFSTNCAEFQEGLISYPHLYGLGGGMYNMGSNPTVTNCMFSGNAAEYHHGKGGGMYNAYSNSIVANCTFSGNTAGSHQHGGGGGMYNEEGYYTTVTNCIFWGNGSYGISGSSVDATYSDIEGGWPGEGNIDADPCFVDLGYWDTNDTPYEPRDDVWIEGDYHLLPGSPCINAGDPNHLFDPNETDLDGKPRVIGCRIDMGAYEYGQLVPSEVKIVPRTINLQSKGKWITCYIWPPEEYDVVEIDSNSILLKCKIEPEFLHVDEQEQVAIARFDREEVQAILYVGQIELIITGKLTDGTTFEATDIIKVTDKAGK